MCGIVGYVGHREASAILLPALRRLEYRGYDSAGVAILNGTAIDVRRSVGKLDALERLLADDPVAGTVGIGHTRWATHGRPSEENAHPHRAGSIVLIHNGIIENFLDLRRELETKGRKLLSETDTEVIAHLVDESLAGGRTLAEATREAVRRLRGSFAIVVMSDTERGRLIAAKTATPIVIGFGKDENFIASDVPAILDHTREVIFLEDGEIAEVTVDGVVLGDFEGRVHEREPRHIAWDPVTARKGGFRHFLVKEIHEQPQALIDTMRGRIRMETASVELPELEGVAERLARAKRISLVACGTAWHAGLAAKFFFEEYAALPVEVDYASEFRYRNLAVAEDDVVVAISQSGETADTLGALEAGQAKGTLGLAISNVVDSSIARRAEAVIYTHAGPEISVASTKAFTTQLTALLLLALHLGERRGTAATAARREILEGLRHVPELVKETLGLASTIAGIARRYAQAHDFLYLGRGPNYPIALEGALKLKEISYIHAEGYPAGEMKHGPIALIDETLPVVVLLPRDALYEKTLSNLKEVESRGARIIALTDDPTDDLRRAAEDVIVVPRTHPLLAPFVFTVPLQLLAYHIAVERGTDVDQPRNLAKSVTVE